MVGAHIARRHTRPHSNFGYGWAASTPTADPPCGHYEEQILELAPDTILVLVTASPDAIRQRMKDNPHLQGAVQDADVERVLERYEEEYADSLLTRKTRLDTTSATIQESTDEIVEKIAALMTDKDSQRIKGGSQEARKLGRSDVTISPWDSHRQLGREIDEDASWRVMDYALDTASLFRHRKVYGGASLTPGAKGLRHHRRPRGDHRHELVREDHRTLDERPRVPRRDHPLHQGRHRQRP